MGQSSSERCCAVQPAVFPEVASVRGRPRRFRPCELDAGPPCPRRKGSVVPEELLWEGRGNLRGDSYLGRCASSRGGVAPTSQRTSETDGQAVNTTRSKYRFCMPA